MVIGIDDAKPRLAMLSGPRIPEALKDLGLRIEIALKDGKAPSEFRVFKAGVNTSTKGDYVYDETSGSATMAYHSKRGMDVMVDYEHASRFATYASDPQKAGRAAGWCKLSHTDGELWATGVEWTPAAKKAIEEKEHRFFSPVFEYETKDDGTRIIGACMQLGLTSTPALDGLAPLAAKDGFNPESTNMEELKKFLAALASQMMLKADATSADVALAVAELKVTSDKLLAALEVKDLSSAMGKIEALKFNSAKTAELTAQVTTMQTDAKKSRTAQMIEAALTSRKISPAEKPFLETFDEVALKSYLEVRAPGTIGGTGVTPPAPAQVITTPTGGTVMLTAEDQFTMKLLGIRTPEQQKKFLELKAQGVSVGNLKPKEDARA